MANGDAAVAAGLGANVVPATDDIRNGYDWINKLADTVAASLLRINAVQAPGTSIEGHWTTAPAGYLLENGAAVSRTTYANLFAALGTRYGAGDGSSTFNLPDSRGRVSVGKGSGQFATLGAKGGAESVVLTFSQMPQHSHPVLGGTVVGTDGGNSAGIQTGGSGYTLVNPSTGLQGDNQPHPNVQPFIVLNRAIKF